MSRTATLTRVEQVYAALRADILAGRYEPGGRLPFADLSAHHQASMGVVREALTRLQGEGLVTSEPQYGFRVASLSIDELRHLTDARSTIEALVIGDSVVNGDLAWESDLLGAHHRLSRTPERAADDVRRLSNEWAAAHASFHLALLAACPNPFLLRTALSLRDAAELYRRWSVQEEPARDITAEHQALLDAALDHDADAASTLIANHIRRTTDILLKHEDLDGRSTDD